MRTPSRPAGVSILPIAVVLGLVLVWAASNLFAPLPLPGDITTYGSQLVKGEVINVSAEGQVVLAGRSQLYQVMDVRLLAGEYEGVVFQVEYGKSQLRSDSSRFQPGDRIYVTVSQTVDGSLKAYYADYDRSFPLALLLGVFVLAILVMGRWKGLGSLISLGISLLVIIAYIIPHILAGEDPVTVSLIGSAILLGCSLYVTYGWNLKTHASVISMVLALSLTGLLTAAFVGLARLTGYGDENAMFLMQFASAAIDPRGLLLGGMIIGALGVLDDLVTSQSSAVVEIHGANPGLGFFETFRRAMHIGQDHVAATVNTLVLAYAGASLPMLLLFSLGQGNVGVLLNSEIMAEEIVRTLVGSLGLVAAVPLSTLVATALILNHDRLGAWGRLLGPIGGSGSAGHHH